MKAQKTAISLLANKFDTKNINKLLLALLLSFTFISCSGNGSSNTSNNTEDSINSTEDILCSDDFGDASRCETRENLE